MNKKQLYTLEYPVRCSPTILYDFLSNPSGLQEWFADHVDDHTARDIRDRAGKMLHCDDETDLRVGKAELFSDQRQQDVKGRGVPMSEAMTGGYEPDAAKRLRSNTRGSSGRIHGDRWLMLRKEERNHNIRETH